MNTWLREAKPEDESFILEIRNAEDVRAWSKNQEVISEATHARWFESQLQDPKSVIWIIEDKIQPLGYIRSKETKDRTWQLSFALGYGARGQGYCNTAIQQACKLLIENQGAQCLLAEVISANSVVIHLLKKSGFVDKRKTQEVGFEIEQLELWAKCSEPRRV